MGNITYRDRLTEAMDLCAEHHALFFGQAVAYPGTGMTDTFKNVPRESLIELPVAEEMQLGLCIGASLGLRRPIVGVYPRWNFLLLAANQLVNHLDKLSLYSDGGYKPKVLIRVAVPTAEPLDPGPQHLGDFSLAFERMLYTVEIERIVHANGVIPAYKRALGRTESTILVEYVGLYTET